MHQTSKSQSEVNIHHNDDDQAIFYELKRPNDWADSVGSLSVISALIFGFSAAVLTNVSQPTNTEKQHYFAAFIILLCCSAGLAFIGLAITSIMYHNIKGFRAYRLDKELLIYEKKSYMIKNIAYYCIYISWAILIVAIVMYCWVAFDYWIARICSIVTAVFLLIGVLLGIYLANLYASDNGDRNIFHICCPERVEEVMEHAETIIEIQTQDGDGKVFEDEE